MNTEVECVGTDGSPKRVVGWPVSTSPVAPGVPLSQWRWVDPATAVPDADQDGTPDKPYASIQKAVDSHPGTLVVGFGAFTITGNVVLPNNTTLFLAGPGNLNGTLTTGNTCFVLTYDANILGAVTLGTNCILTSYGGGSPQAAVTLGSGSALFIDASGEAITAMDNISGDSTNNLFISGKTLRNITAGQVKLRNFGIGGSAPTWSCTTLDAQDLKNGQGDVLDATTTLGVRLVNVPLNGGAAFHNAAGHSFSIDTTTAQTFGASVVLDHPEVLLVLGGRRTIATGSTPLAKIGAGSTANLGPFTLNIQELPTVDSTIAGALTHAMGITTADGLPNTLVARLYRDIASADNSWMLFLSNTNADDDITVNWAVYGQVPAT